MEQNILLALTVHHLRKKLYFVSEMCNYYVKSAAQIKIQFPSPDFLFSDPVSDTLDSADPNTTLGTTVKVALYDCFHCPLCIVRLNDSVLVRSSRLKH